MADELYSRVLGQHPTLPKILVDPFSAAAYLRANGTITQQQFADLASVYGQGVPLGADGLADAAELVTTVTGSPANQLQRIHTIEYVLHLSDTAPPPHLDTPVKVRQLLGLPAARV